MGGVHTYISPLRSSGVVHREAAEQREARANLVHFGSTTVLLLGWVTWLCLHAKERLSK